MYEGKDYLMVVFGYHLEMQISEYLEIQLQETKKVKKIHVKCMHTKKMMKTIEKPTNLLCRIETILQ